MKAEGGRRKADEGREERGEGKDRCAGTSVHHSSFCIQHSSSNPQFLIPNPSFLLLLDPPAPGPWNMAVDEVLLESAAAEGQCTLRFYGWEEPTLSLGYFQTYADRWQHSASSRSAVVRRSSGGGAILHDRELTYSLAIPSRHPLAIDRLGSYQAVHAALIEVLALWGIEATLFGQQTDQSNSPPSVLPPTGYIQNPKQQPFLCFQRRSPGDVLIGLTKIAGSAQRRCRGAVLQHGSILLAQSPAAPELDGVKEITGKEISPHQLVETWLARLANALPITWQGGALSDEQRRRAEMLATQKYATTAWTESRGREVVSFDDKNQIC
jgi:lipoate-protein ligase A